MIRALRYVAGLVALGVAVACGTKEAPGPLEPGGPVGRVRFVNLITDTTRGRVNAILENVPFGVNLTYTQSTPATLPAPSTANYSSILAGPRSLVLKRTADTSVVVATVNFTAVANVDQTVYATGGAVASAITSLVVNDTNPAVATNQTRLRLVNLSPTAGPVDVFVTAVNADLATATPTFSNVAYRAASAYVNVAPGTYQIRVVPAGTAPGSRGGAVSVNVASVALAGGTARTTVTADRNTGGAPLTAFILADR